MNRETFETFLERHSQYQPQPGELIGSVYRKQHAAFVAYVDSEVSPRVDLLIERLRQLDEALARAACNE